MSDPESGFDDGFLDCMEFALPALRAVLDAMAVHPILIERAIVITEKGAVIARPPERATEVL